MIRTTLVLILFFISNLACGADWPGKKSQWRGYDRFDFQVDGKDAYVVVPKKKADGNPWVWRARFPNFHAEADLLLLERGFHVARINTDGMLGSPTAMKHWDAFYGFVTKRGLNQKVALEGVSRGGLFVYGFASRWPERVACIYADTPVCDIKSWPGGKGIGRGHEPTWQNCLKQYGFTEQQALEYRGNPIDTLKPIAAAKIPALHIVSLTDEIVPPTENTFILAKRFEKLGGSIDIIEVEKGTEQSGGHHFTHPDPKRVADFIERHAAQSKSAEPNSKTKHPNIVFIMVDDMGYGDPGCYNPNSKIPTPNIDSLAAAGMRFTDAHASGPLCHVSRYGLLTGIYPFRAKPNEWGKKPTINDGQTTIASLLKSAGYQTAMVGKWHLGFHENGYDKPLRGGPVDRGFDTFFGIRASTDIPPYFYIRNDKAVQPPTKPIDAMNSKGWSPIQGAFWRKGLIAPELELKDVLPRFTDEAISVIDKHAKSETEEPLFLYLAYPAPHTPWLPSDEFKGKSGAGMYGDFGMMVDAMIGRVLSKLDEARMSDNTLVIFTSDNGPVWYKQDVERFDHDSSGGLRGMKADAWEAGHRMPFIARWPGTVKASSTSGQTICFTDMLATFADITDQTLPSDNRFDSHSILPVLEGNQPDGQPIRDSLVIKAGRGHMTIRSGKWKLITGLGSGGFSKPNKIKPEKGGATGQLYNLEIDLEENYNLFLKRPDMVELLQAELEDVVDDR